MTYFTMNPLNIIDKLADQNHHGGARVGLPECIILHATAGVDSGDWLQWQSSPAVSAHRLINKQGQIYKIVPDDKIAFHAGYGAIGSKIGPGKINLNRRSLGLEVENLNNGKDPYPDAQIWATSMQVAEWWSLYGFLPILSHEQVDTQGKTDPKGFPWTKFWVNLFQIVTQSLPRLFDRAKVESALSSLMSAQNQLTLLLDETEG